MLFKYKIERNQRHSASSTGKIGDPEYRKKKKKNPSIRNHFIYEANIMTNFELPSLKVKIR